MGLEDKDVAIMGFCLGSAALVFIVCVCKSRRRKNAEEHELVPLTTTRVPDENERQYFVSPPPRWELFPEDVLHEKDFADYPVARSEKMVGTVVEEGRANEEIDMAEAPIEEEPIEEAPIEEEPIEEPIEEARIEEAPIEETRWRNALTPAEAQKAIARGYRKKRLQDKFNKWKGQEQNRRRCLVDGVTGSIEMSVDNKMVVTTLQSGGPASEAGIKMGDIILVIRRKGRGGRIIEHPLRDKQHFLGAIGPQAEVFEGTKIDILAASTDKQKKRWMNSASEADTTLDGWMKRVEAAKADDFEITVGSETETDKETRRKQMNTVARQKDLPIEAVDLADCFLSNAKNAKRKVEVVFNKIDEDGSGQLNINGIHEVFKELTRDTCLPQPDEKYSERIFSVMDESEKQKVTFDECYPYIKWEMVKMITNEFLQYEQNKDE